MMAGSDIMSWDLSNSRTTPFVRESVLIYDIVRGILKLRR